MPNTDEPSSYAPMSSLHADRFSQLDVERVCRVLIRIANYFEEHDHEELSKERQEQPAAVNGLGTR